MFTVGMVVIINPSERRLVERNLKYGPLTVEALAGDSVVVSKQVTMATTGYAHRYSPESSGMFVMFYRVPKMLLEPIGEPLKEIV